MKQQLFFRALLGCLCLSFFAQAQPKLLTQDVIWSGSLSPKRASGFRSMKDGEHYTNTVTTGIGKAILRYDFKTGNPVDTIFRSSDLPLDARPLVFENYQLSDDEKAVLFSVGEEQIYRHSSKADYYVYNRTTHKLTYITGAGKAMYATFSPDGQRIAFVRENNLFIYDIASGKEQQLTTDGKRNAIINGATDWVYEEEFAMSTAFAWSPDGSKLAFYKFDESRVKEFTLTTYGDLYPKEEPYKYPKAGELNSLVDVYVYHLNTGKTVLMQTGEKEYLPRMKWTRDSNTLSIQRSNRLQNHLDLLLCNATTGTATVLLTETSKAFVEVTDDLFFLQDGKRFIWTSARSGYNHIYLYELSGKLVRQITSGNWEVTQYYGFDESTGQFYFQSAERHPSERQIWSVDLKGKKKLLTPQSGSHDAAFSSGFHYFVDTYSRYGQPYSYTVKNNKGDNLRVLEDNSKLTAALKEYQLSPVDTFSFTTTQHISLNGWMIKPPGFDATKKYPVLMFVYGGPGRQTVKNEWQNTDFLYHQLLAQKGYVIVSVDNRGTQGRGAEFLNCIYGNMGGPEVEDQVETAKWLIQQPWVNQARLGIWGWSFGGYMSSLLMTRCQGLFKAGIAVAPVTNWRYYDSIYTERYLKTPQENPKGYDENSPITYAKDLQGKFLLVHGSGDDNVHMQNSMDFINELVKANKRFDLMIYPNRSHSIRGDGARLHLYNKMESFILENL